MSGPVVTVLIDLPVTPRYHGATVDAPGHADLALRAGIILRVVPTDQIDDSLVADPGQGVVVGPGSPYANPEGVHDVIRSARERGVPLVGT